MSLIILYDVYGVADHLMATAVLVLSWLQFIVHGFRRSDNESSTFLQTPSVTKAEDARSIFMMSKCSSGNLRHVYIKIHRKIMTKTMVMI